MKAKYDQAADSQTYASILSSLVSSSSREEAKGEGAGAGANGRGGGGEEEVHSPPSLIGPTYTHSPVNIGLSGSLRRKQENLGVRYSIYLLSLLVQKYCRPCSGFANVDAKKKSWGAVTRRPSSGFVNIRQYFEVC